ncbi:MAG: hypothetical protein GX657_14740 [Chloroflexi bacterium]|nr:hypothetical protein [Chloroflexota bacterium]
MRPALRALVLVLFVLSMALAAGPALAQGAVSVTVYYSPTCGHCTDFLEGVWPGIAEQYGPGLSLSLVDVRDVQGMEALEADEARLGAKAPDIPVVVVGDRLLFDLDVERLGQAVREAIEATKAGGGAAGQVPSATAAAAEGTPSAAAIHLAYVEKDGCSECDRARLVLEAVAAEVPSLVVTTLNNVRDASLVEAIGLYRHLPEAERLAAPSLYVGDAVLIGDEITTAHLRAALAPYLASGAGPFWEALETSAGRQSIVERFQSMGVVAVAAAALLDGINPCAFATILFFVSYLAVSRRPRRDLLFVGLAFTVGVFLTYLLVGLGAMRLLALASAVRIVGPILYGLLGAGCLVLAGLSLYDYVLARRGQLQDMRLNLPDALREKIKSRIRAASGAYIGAALVTGLMVSLLELACTGQVYLPTISFMVGVAEMRASAVGYLVLYNVVFVLPLLAVLLLAVYGVSAGRVQDWFVRHAASTKLLMAVLFLLLGGLLIAQVAAM